MDLLIYRDFDDVRRFLQKKGFNEADFGEGVDGIEALMFTDFYKLTAPLPTFIKDEEKFAVLKYIYEFRKSQPAENDLELLADLKKVIEIVEVGMYENNLNTAKRLKVEILANVYHLRKSLGVESPENLKAKVLALISSCQRNFYAYFYKYFVEIDYIFQKFGLNILEES